MSSAAHNRADKNKKRYLQSKRAESKPNLASYFNKYLNSKEEEKEDPSKVSQLKDFLSFLEENNMLKDDESQKESLLKAFLAKGDNKENESGNQCPKQREDDIAISMNSS